MTIPAATFTATETTDEQAYIAAAQRGDKAAFGRIVELHHRLVVGVAYRLSGDADLADDVAQDTFITAWQHLSRFNPERSASLRAWLCRIAHNRTLDALRRRQPETLDPRQPDPGPTGSAWAGRAEIDAAVQAAILRLPEAARAALVLREFEELTYAEIAAALGIPIGTVMSRLHTARRRLAEELALLMKAGVEQ